MLSLNSSRADLSNADDGEANEAEMIQKNQHSKHITEEEDEYADQGSKRISKPKRVSTKEVPGLESKGASALDKSDVTGKSSLPNNYMIS